MMILDSKQKGNLTELQCLTAFAQLGLTVSIPYGDHARYDFIIDVDNKLYKVQCKTASKQEEGVYNFSCRSTAANHSRAANRTYTADEIDFFATVIKGQCYLIPVQETSSHSKNLRFVPPKNGQKVGIAYAKDYALDVQIQKLLGVKN